MTNSYKHYAGGRRGHESSATSRFTTVRAYAAARLQRVAGAPASQQHRSVRGYGAARLARVVGKA